MDTGWLVVLQNVSRDVERLTGALPNEVFAALTGAEVANTHRATEYLAVFGDLDAISDGVLHFGGW